MKKSALEKIKKSLFLQKKELESKSYQIEIDVDGDETDEIQGSLIATVNNQLSVRDREKLLMIELALKKMENGSFGLCEDCSEPISEKRLDINPYFISCISCAEQREIESKQRKK